MQVWDGQPHLDKGSGWGSIRARQTRNRGVLISRDARKNQRAGSPKDPKIFVGFRNKSVALGTTSPKKTCCRFCRFGVSQSSGALERGICAFRALPVGPMLGVLPDTFSLGWTTAPAHPGRSFEAGGRSGQWDESYLRTGANVSPQLACVFSFSVGGTPSCPLPNFPALAVLAHPQIKFAAIQIVALYGPQKVTENQAETDPKSYFWLSSTSWVRSLSARRFRRRFPFGGESFACMLKVISLAE